MTIRELISAYPSLSLSDRLHMIIRWRVCPLPKIASFVPESGPIVDLGCGHGLFSLLLAQQSSKREVIGIDLDEHKIALAQQLTSPHLRFVAGDIATADLPPATAVTILDVLYLIPFEVQKRLLAICAEKLESRGTIVLADVAERPRWKFWLTWLEETIAVRGLRITANSDAPQFYFRTRAEWQKLFHDLGFDVETIPLDKGYYHSHVVFLARKRS